MIFYPLERKHIRQISHPTETMKRFGWKTGASKEGEEEKSKGKKDSSNPPKEKGKGGKKESAGSKQEQKPSQKERKPNNPQGTRKEPNTVRGAQSALRPGNNSGITKQKGNPEVQFGPLLKEFLSSREMVNQGIAISYEHKSGNYEITVSFKKVLENGVSTSGLVSLRFEDYLAQRKTLLKVKDDSTHYMAFVTKLLDRLGVDITHAKPSVAFKSVEGFVLKHLSPVEKVLLSLSDEEYDRVDTKKVPEIMRPSMEVINSTYGGLSSRSETLVRIINTEGPVVDVVPPNWVLNGVSGMSKGALLDALRIVHKPEISVEQEQTIKALQESLFGSDSATASSTHKSEDFKETREDDPL